MDAYLKKEQIGTLFVRVGAPEGGLGGGGQGGPAQISYAPIHIFFLEPPAACVIFIRSSYN